AQRKFIDLIKEASFKWANWDPLKVIQIGDFGTIDKKTGELRVEGNVFTHPEIKHIAQDYPAYVAPETDLNQIHSLQVRRLGIQADVGGSDSPADEGVIYKTRWQFNSKRGAILLMHRPRLICVPDGFFYEKFDLPILKRKVVVKQVYNCPGFYMYLSNEASEQVSVTLRTNAFPFTGASTEQGLTVGWSADGSTGVSQHAFRQDAVYTPLFHLSATSTQDSTGRHRITSWFRHMAV
ncbi:hypothetical protein BJY52DRAFT_1129605, partial [Lactarius psammicola]